VVFSGILFTLSPIFSAADAAAQNPTGTVFEVDSAELLRLRQGYLAFWRQLENDPALDGAERFGCLVQHVVEDTTRVAGVEVAEEEVKRRILDHLVDILVPQEHRDEKELVMDTAALIESGAIVESPADLADFRTELQQGDGRFRHFAMNAAAAYQVPDLLVDLAARFVGRDFDPAEDPSGDSAADLLANEIGREFAAFLEDHSLSELVEAQVVKVWLIERFGRP
jgi:hypothetical protein